MDLRDWTRVLVGIIDRRCKRQVASRKYKRSEMLPYAGI